MIILYFGVEYNSVSQVYEPIEICDNALNVQYINRAYETNTGCKR